MPLYLVPWGTMKTLSTIFATLALFAGSLILAAPAEAGYQGCISRAENRRVDLGMKRGRVHRIIGTHGKFWDGHAGGYTHQYRACWTNQFRFYWTYAARPFTRKPTHKLAERTRGEPTPSPCPSPCI
jgi:hypothetical protein